MLQYFCRTTNARILSFVIICATTWLWLAVQEIVPTPRITFSDHDWHSKTPPPLPVGTPVVGNASCEKAPSSDQNTKLSETLFPVSHPETNGSWVGENHKMLQALFRCIELSSCAQNQRKVVLLVSYHFLGAFSGHVGGEDMWARSTMQALRNMGYTFLFSPNIEQTIQHYHMMPHFVKAILMEPPEADACFQNEANCVLSNQNPDGIPAWKIFSFHFWTYPVNPLGHKWTLSPEDYPLDDSANNYLGYSVEPSCMQQPFRAPQERNNQAYILAKWQEYLDKGAWPFHFYEAASNATGIQFVMGANDEGVHPDPPPGITNLGTMAQPAFLDILSKSLVLVGLGDPLISPTPYEALCLGVPFINPILDWNRDDPQDRTSWYTQHGGLKFHDPPYVYNVFRDDLDGFIGAINNSMQNPIERYVLERMRMSSVADRLQTILETDWKSEAIELLAHRQATGEGPTFVI